MQKLSVRSYIAFTVVFLMLGIIFPTVILGHSESVGTPGFSQRDRDQFDDGYESLPPRLKGFSISSLVAAGLIHPRNVPWTSVKIPPTYENPSTTINWASPVNISAQSGGMSGSTEPAAAMHPFNPLLAISGGNSNDPDHEVRIENSTDSGLTWQRRAEPPPYAPLTSDGVPVWLANHTNNGNTVLFSSAGHLNGQGDAALQVNLSKSLNRGVNWSSMLNTNVNANLCPPTPQCDHDREYLWTDQNPNSPYYGRTYLTEVVASHDANPDYPTYLAVGLRWTTDKGNTWSNFVPANDTSEARRYLNWNQFPSLAILPNGNIVLVWRRGMCCGDADIMIPGPNKEMWALSTDGGQTFIQSGIISEMSTQQSVVWGSSSPPDSGFAGFHWSDTPNVTADPVDGTLYATWVAYRSPNNNTTAGVYISRGIISGSYITWFLPVLVNNSYPNKYQFFPWVQVSRDHTVHVTYGAALPSGTLNREVGKFYVQSTDQGQTFTTPFWLTGAYMQAQESFMGDYDAVDIGGYNGATGTIMTTWTDTRGGPERYGRFGTFSYPIPTPTACSISYDDAPVGSTYYDYIRCAVCLGIAGGYSGDPNYYNPCLVPPGYEVQGHSYFRPCNNITRGQISKIVSGAAHFNDEVPQNQQTFEDVPPGSTFWVYIERLASRGVMAGYPCGNPEPCVPPANRPYFRPSGDATRGQISKLVSNGAGYEDVIQTGQQSFQDVPNSNDFWQYVERLVMRGVMSGYPCGGTAEPCVPPLNRPYFRPGSQTTRGQTVKIVMNAFYPGCSPPSNESPSGNPLNPPSASPSAIGSPTGIASPAVTTSPTPVITPSPTVAYPTRPPYITPIPPPPVPSIPLPLPSVQATVRTGSK